MAASPMGHNLLLNVCKGLFSFGEYSLDVLDVLELFGHPCLMNLRALGLFLERVGSTPRRLGFCQLGLKFRKRATYPLAKSRTSSAMSLVNLRRSLARASAGSSSSPPSASALLPGPEATTDWFAPAFQSSSTSSKSFLSSFTCLSGPLSGAWYPLRSAANRIYFMIVPYPHRPVVFLHVRPTRGSLRARPLRVPIHGHAVRGPLPDKLRGPFRVHPVHGHLRTG